MRIQKLGFYAMAGSLLIATPTIFAATDGTLGATSTGTVNVSITIPFLVQISGLSDITIGTPGSFTVPATGSTTACIFSNQTAPVGGYSITATSTQTLIPGTFQVGSGGNRLTYTATWNDGTGAATLTSGATLTGRQNASGTSTTCNGTPNATFAVSFSAAAMQAAPQGSYADVVSLLVAPA